MSQPGAPVLVSYVFCNTLPQVYGPKAAHFYPLVLLEVRSLKWVCRTVFLLETRGENPFLPFQLLEAAHAP